MMQYNSTKAINGVGSFGFVREIKEYDDGTIRYMVGVPVPTKGTAYIFVTDKENALEKIGQAILMPKEEEDDE